MRTHVISSYVRTPLFLFVLLTLLVLSACGQTTPPATTSNTPTAEPASVLDYYGTPVVFPEAAPQRIVSLTPSTSEILAALGLEEHVVAVDSFTDYPAEMAEKPVVSDATGGYDVELITSHQPDLVLSSAGFSKGSLAEMQNANLTVVDLPGANFQEAIDQILTIGRLTFTEDVAEQVVADMQQEIDAVAEQVADTTAPQVLLMVDYAHSPGRPYVFGGGSFGDELLEKANAINIFHDNTESGGYPQVTDEAIISKNPDVVILTELPDFGGYKPDDVYGLSTWGSVTAVEERQVHYINSNIIQRPGPRLAQALRCIAQVVHPAEYTETLPEYCTVTV